MQDRLRPLIAMCLLPTISEELADACSSLMTAAASFQSSVGVLCERPQEILQWCALVCKVHLDLYITVWSPAGALNHFKGSLGSMTDGSNSLMTAAASSQT